MADPIDDDRQRFLTLVERWHAGHPRPDQVRHCTSVAAFLENALARELVTVKDHRTMLLAALGHDLYEDSDIDPEEIARDFGAGVDSLIQRLTHVGAVENYVEQVAVGPEEARLIKSPRAYSGKQRGVCSTPGGFGRWIGTCF